MRAPSRATLGWINGLLGVAFFSGSLPATKLAVSGFDPVFVTFARATIAALAAAAMLAASRASRPRRADLAALAMIAGGVVIGFPLLCAMALARVSSAHATLFIGLLPIATAIFAVLRGRERPRAAFWGFALAGSGIVALQALGGGGAASAAGDGLMLAGIVICGFGYAEGAVLARRLGGWPVIAWALVLSLPVSLPIAILLRPASIAAVSLPALAGLGYVSLFSMLIGFIFWYKGLALGGIASVGQAQMLQPLLGLILSALLLGESVPASLVVATLGVVACVAGAKRFAT
jgi:drug/metabolite transporter (DMT)-like permease